MSQTSAETIIVFLERDIDGRDICVSRTYQQLLMDTFLRLETSTDFFP